MGGLSLVVRLIPDPAARHCTSLPATAVSASDLHNNHDKLAVSLPRVLPPEPWIDLLWGYDDDAAFAAAVSDALSRPAAIAATRSQSKQSNR